MSRIAKKPLNKTERAIYRRLKKSFQHIKSHLEGKIKLQTIEEVLDTFTISTGIGRKATDAELIDYLSRETDTEPIDLESAFSKYSSAK